MVTQDPGFQCGSLALSHALMCADTQAPSPSFCSVPWMRERRQWRENRGAIAFQTTCTNPFGLASTFVPGAEFSGVASSGDLENSQDELGF